MQGFRKTGIESELIATARANLDLLGEMVMVGGRFTVVLPPSPIYQRITMGLLNMHPSPK